jgi:hypothetical protein
MPQVTPTDAAQKLIKKVQEMDLDDLRDAHNELFPETPIPKTVLPSEGEAVRKRVLDYLADGVAVEELIDLWSAVFPEAWNVYFDEESGTIHYLVEPEAMPQAD